jgi:hypothetical protein
VKREILIGFEFEVGNCMIDRFGPGETALSDGIGAQGNETAIAPVGECVLGEQALPITRRDQSGSVSIHRRFLRDWKQN